MMGGMFLLPVFVQTFLGYTATQTGYLFMPMAACMMIASPLGVSLIGKVQARYVIALSTLIAALGLYLFTGLDPRSGPLELIIPLSVLAFGLGFGMAQRTNLIASVVPTSEIGIASSILALVRNISGAFGIALFGSILTNRIETNLITVTRYSVVNTTNPLIRAQIMGLMQLKADIDSYRNVFVISAIIMVGAAIVAALTLKVKEVKGTAQILVD